MPSPHRCALRALALSLPTPPLEVALCPLPVPSLCPPRFAHLTLPTHMPSPRHSLCPPCPHSESARALALPAVSPALGLGLTLPLRFACCWRPHSAHLALPTLMPSLDYVPLLCPRPRFTCTLTHTSCPYSPVLSCALIAHALILPAPSLPPCTLHLSHKCILH